MVRHVDVHGQQDLTSREMPVRGVMRLGELLFREAADYPGTIGEGIAEEFDDGIFLVRGGKRRGLRILEAGAELIICGGDMGHQLAEGHGVGMRLERILIRRHGLSDRDRKFAERLKVLCVFPGGRVFERGRLCA